MKHVLLCSRDCFLFKQQAMRVEHTSVSRRFQKNQGEMWSSVRKLLWHCETPLSSGTLFSGSLQYTHVVSRHLSETAETMLSEIELWFGACRFPLSLGRDGSDPGKWMKLCNHVFIRSRQPWSCKKSSGLCPCHRSMNGTLPVEA